MRTIYTKKDMRRYIESINKLSNKINYIHNELHLEKNNERKSKLMKELEILKLQKEIAVIRKKIKELELR